MSKRLVGQAESRAFDVESSPELPATSLTAQFAKIAPGILFSAVVAVAAFSAAPILSKIFPVPTMVVALIIGIVLHRFASKEIFLPGLTFCVKGVLRFAVALLGLRIALSEIYALGLLTAVEIVVAMAVTLLSGFFLARVFGKNAAFGALAGAGTAVCGASATLATATVLPAYQGKAADVAFVVVAVNFLSTVAMVVYPPLSAAIGFDPPTTGILLGATIHDVAQVAGAGYGVSEAVGNTAIIVKLFRVFLLLPVVVGVSLYFMWQVPTGKVPVPYFAFVFLALCLVNSVVPATGLAALYAPIKSVLVEVSSWGLLIAISALGLNTSMAAICDLGWRHVAVVVGTTLVILLVMATFLYAF